MQSFNPDGPPRFSLPKAKLFAGACDAHAHVFGPYNRFPLSETRSYTPPETTADAHAEMLQSLGFERAVLVQPSAYGVDNRCLMDAVARDPARRRAVGVLDPSVSDDALAALRKGGLVGLRFVEIVSQRYGGRPRGSIGYEELISLAPRLRAHGLHAESFAAMATFAARADELLKTQVPIVLGHMASAGGTPSDVGDPTFQRVLALLREGRVWVKLTVIRRSEQAPYYRDARPFHDAMIEANADQLVWGTDWPLVNMGERTPDLGPLVDLFDEWVRDETLKRKILVDNPKRLYGFA